MLLRRVIEHVKSQNWFAVFIDFLIVVVGLFVGLQVDNWWQERSEARRETAYLFALRQDFSQEVAELEGDKKRYEDIAVAMIQLLEWSESDQLAESIDELVPASSYLVSMVATSVFADTYDNLKGSGDLRLLRNQELKRQLAAFYAKEKVVQLVSASHEMQFVNIYTPYLIENLDYRLALRRMDASRLPTALSENWPDQVDVERIVGVLKTQQFKNIASAKLEVSATSILVIDEALVPARRVVALLDEEVGL